MGRPRKPKPPEQPATETTEPTKPPEDGEVCDISKEQYREMGAIDTASKRRNERTKSTVAARQKGERVRYNGDADERYETVAQALAGTPAMVYLRRNGPTVGNFPPVALATVPSWHELIHHIERNYWTGQRETYQVQVRNELSQIETTITWVIEQNPEAILAYNERLRAAGVAAAAPQAPPARGPYGRPVQPEAEPEVIDLEADPDMEVDDEDDEDDEDLQQEHEEDMARNQGYWATNGYQPLHIPPGAPLPPGYWPMQGAAQPGYTQAPMPGYPGMPQGAPMPPMAGYPGVPGAPPMPPMPGYPGAVPAPAPAPVAPAPPVPSEESKLLREELQQMRERMEKRDRELAEEREKRAKELAEAKEREQKAQRALEDTIRDQQMQKQIDDVRAKLEHDYNRKMESISAREAALAAQNQQVPMQQVAAPQNTDPAAMGLVDLGPDFAWKLDGGKFKPVFVGKVQGQEPAAAHQPPEPRRVLENLVENYDVLSRVAQRVNRHPKDDAAEEAASHVVAAAAEAVPAKDKVRFEDAGGGVKLAINPDESINWGMSVLPVVAGIGQHIPKLLDHLSSERMAKMRVLEAENLKQKALLERASQEISRVDQANEALRRRQQIVVEHEPIVVPETVVVPPAPPAPPTPPPPVEPPAQHHPAPVDPGPAAESDDSNTHDQQSDADTDTALHTAAAESYDVGSSAQGEVPSSDRPESDPLVSALYAPRRVRSNSRAPTR